MPDIALVTSAAARSLDADMAPLLDALRALELSCRVVDWDDPSARWHDFKLALLRSPWDYPERHREFSAWLDRVAACSQLINPLELVRWNLDKRYLGALAARGIATVPTTFFEPGQKIALPAALERVVKPTISAGSRDTVRHSDLGRAEQHVAALLAAQRAVMVQPYLARVDELGETALLFFDGVFSHAIRKGPLLSRDGEATQALFATEDIRPRTPEADELALAHAVLAALPFAAPPTYARVDLLRDDTGRPVLLELELIEPSLFFAQAPGAVSAFASIVKRAWGQSIPSKSPT